MALFGGITIPGAPDLENVRRLDLLPLEQVRRMMRVGIAIDPEWFHALTLTLSAKQDDLKKSLACQFPQESLDSFVSASTDEDITINPDSSVQVAKLLFEALGVGQNRDVRLKRTKAGQISTGKKQLETMKHEHEAVRLILAYRECSKLKNTYCVAPGTKVLTRDLQWTDAGALHEGNEILGFDEVPVESQWRKWRRGIVEFSTIECRPCHRLIFDDGSEIICTGDHLWLARRGPKTRLHWVRTDQLWSSDTSNPYNRQRRDWRVAKPLDLWRSLIGYEAGYLAGSYDSEGYLTKCAHSESFRIGYTQKAGPVFDRVLTLLERHGFSPTTVIGSSGGVGKQNADYINIGRSAECLRLLSQVRPVRLLAKYLAIDALPNINLSRDVALVRREFVGERDVAVLKTSTGTFIANGFASHNCTKLPQIARVHPRGPDCPLCGLYHAVAHPRVHTQILPTRAATGRFQSKGPNLFNIPARTANGREVRKGFIAQPGETRRRNRVVLAGNDLAQIELRILADRARERNMIRIFLEGLDIHADTAMRAFGKTLEEVTKLVRRADPDGSIWAAWDGDAKAWKIRPEWTNAYSDYDRKVSGGEAVWYDFDGKMLFRAPCKNVNFGVAYGLSAPGLYDLMAVTYATAGLPLPEFITLDWCDQFIKKWFELYPDAEVYFATQHYRAFQFGIVWDMFGRVRRVPEIQSCHEDVREAGLRQAGNHPIQSGNAGILKIAMARIERRFEYLRQDCGVHVEALLPIYDEVLAECDEDWADEVNDLMGEEMRAALVDEETQELQFRVPVLSDGHVMERWVKD